jgi:hypothetical protein
VHQKYHIKSAGTLYREGEKKMGWGLANGDHIITWGECPTGQYPSSSGHWSECASGSEILGQVCS